MPSRFSQRSNQLEIMDDLSCAGDVVDQTLRELDTINLLLGGNPVTVSGVRQLAGKNSNVRLIADLGCGSGKMLKVLSKKSWLQNATFVGYDANPNITAFAERHNPDKNKIEFVAADILSENFRRENFDIALATLFFHHFASDQLAEILGALHKQCRIGIVINDLHRHWFAYYSIRFLTRILSRSAMVKFDAPVSVLRGFRKRELESILKNAGIDNYTIRWKWAFRWQIIIRK